MASLNTNSAAITALRTLQNTNNDLDKTQNRISTGYKIGEAKDNAAYWAISATLKSDNKSLGTVKDALNLGASTVDTAYQGLNKAKDVLDEIKSKLTAATQDGVNRDTIQNEIKQLQDQLKSIATSSVFSGENWLSVDTSTVGFNPEKQVVASFSRDGNGAVSIGTILVQTADVALFDSSTVYGSGAIIDGAVNLKGKDGRDLAIGGTDVTTGNTAKAGLTETGTTGVSGAAATAISAAGAGLGTNDKYSTSAYTAAGITGSTLVAGDTFTMTVTKSTGGTQTQTITVGADASAQGILDAMRGGLSGMTGFTYTTAAGGGLTLTNSTIETANYQITISGFSAHTASFATTTPVAGGPGTAATISTTAIAAGDYAAGDRITIKLNVNGTSTTITTAALAPAGASLTTAEVATAIDTAMTGYANVALGAGGVLTFTAPSPGLKTSFSLEEYTLRDSTGKVKTATGTNASGAAKFETGSFTAVTLDKDDNIYFKIQVDDATSAKNITIDQALVNKTLSTSSVPVTDGSITSAADFKKVVEAALKVANVTNVKVAVTNTDKLTFTTDSVGADAKVIISDVEASKGGDTITVDTIDISDEAFASFSSDEVKEVLSAYIDVVNAAITKVTDAAASLGSVASRLDLQKSFVNTLMDTIDKGVGNLIDADMSEESTKLQALQVKQQLGVQALSIANQSSQNILALFQSNT